MSDQDFRKVSEEEKAYIDSKWKEDPESDTDKEDEPVAKPIKTKMIQMPIDILPDGTFTSEYVISIKLDPSTFKKIDLTEECNDE
jgi:hypothetical protein